MQGDCPKGPPVPWQQGKGQNNWKGGGADKGHAGKGAARYVFNKLKGTGERGNVKVDGTNPREECMVSMKIGTHRQTGMTPGEDIGAKGVVARETATTHRSE